MNEVLEKPKSKVNVTVVLTRELDRRLDQFSKEQGESRSAVIREAVAAFLKQAQVEGRAA